MRKLYNEDSFLFEFEAVVTGCSYHDKKKLYEISLNQTAFFPEGGGQPSDLGYLYPENQEALIVLDVQEKENQVIHYLEKPIPVGEKLIGKIDSCRRLDFMQQHTGEHILSGLVNKHFGADNVGFHLGLSEVTLDFNKPLELSSLRQLEMLANQAIWQDIPIQAEFPKEEVLVNLDYRSKLELTEDIRIVTIPGFDICACCAPHLKSTGQVGLLKITNVQAHRGGVRVNILCGRRALEDYTKKQDNIFSISASLSSKQDETAYAVSRLKEETLQIKEENNILQTKLLLEIAKTLPSPEASCHALLIIPPMYDIAIRNMINELTLQYSGYVAVFWGDDVNGYRYLIGSKNRDCREIGTLLKEKFNAKGGGKAPMIQGTAVTTGETLKEIWISL